eukprot:Tamp_10011.p2 GENE.Tamp_10011~~Tamp_10011.p2  ORF type:complete len:290 (+),score=33.26 Tamp_10011:1167-2036(+)
MKTPGGKVTKYSKFVEMQVVYGLTPDGAAQRSGRIQIGDKILSLNRENLAHVGGDAVKKKFKEAQRQNDHVLLALLRNGKELKFKIHLLANWYEENAHQHGRRSSSPTRSSRSSSPTRSRHGDSYAFPEQRPAQANVAMNAMGMRNMNMDVPIIAQGDPLRRWQSPALPRIPGGRMFPTQSPFMGSCLWLALACMIFVCSSMDRIDQAERYRHANGEGAQYANVIKSTNGKQCACTPIAAAIARTNFRSHLSPQRNFRSHLFPQRFTAGIAATAPAQRRPTAATEKLVG